MKNEQISTEEAKKIVTKEVEKTMVTCQKEIQQVLDKHNCIIDVGMLITPRGNIPQVKIMPKPVKRR